MATSAQTVTDAVIVGAGPVGIYQAFQLGLLELGCHIVDALPHPGGQCVELYGDKPIYDIPGLPVCTGQQLVDGLLQQVRPFAPPMHLGQLVSTLERQDDGTFLLSTTAGIRLKTKVVFIAAGVGAFLPRCPSVDGLRALASTQLHFSLDALQARGNAEHVLIIGDNEDALQAALQLAQTPEQPGRAKPVVTLIHRRDAFTAEPATQRAFRDAVASGALRFLSAQLTAVDVKTDAQQGVQKGVLQSVSVADTQGAVHTLAVDQILVLQGLSPQLGPVSGWGLAMQRKMLQADPATMATSAAGIYAVGDIAHYPGKKRLIACGFHEAILAAFAAAHHIDPQRRELLQYTSSSAHLQALLGVENTAGS